MTTTIRTGKAGKLYYVNVAGMTYTLMLAEDRRFVAMYSPSHMLGMYAIERFDGALNPAGIRAFLAQTGTKEET